MMGCLMSKITDWLYMLPEEKNVVDFKNALPEEEDLEVWEEADVFEVNLSGVLPGGKTASIDFETIRIPFKDEFGNKFLEKNGVVKVYAVSFQEEAYERAQEIFKRLVSRVGGFFAGDTEDFEPIVK